MVLPMVDGPERLGWAAVGEEPGTQAAVERARLGHAGLALLDPADEWVPPGGPGRRVDGHELLRMGRVVLGSTIDLPVDWKVKGAGGDQPCGLCSVNRSHETRATRADPLG